MCSRVPDDRASLVTSYTSEMRLATTGVYVSQLGIKEQTIPVGDT